MIQRALASYPLAYLNGVALILFFAVFFGALVWVLRGSSQNFYEELAKLPFEEKTNE